MSNSSNPSRNPENRYNVFRVNKEQITYEGHGTASTTDAFPQPEFSPAERRIGLGILKCHDDG
jgi:hypothetical protein